MAGRISAPMGRHSPWTSSGAGEFGKRAHRGNPCSTFPSPFWLGRRGTCEHRPPKSHPQAKRLDPLADDHPRRGPHPALVERLPRPSCCGGPTPLGKDDPTPLGKDDPLVPLFLPLLVRCQGTPRSASPCPCAPSEASQRKATPAARFAKRCQRSPSGPSRRCKPLPYASAATTCTTSSRPAAASEAQTTPALGDAMILSVASMCAATRVCHSSAPDCAPACPAEQSPARRAVHPGHRPCSLECLKPLMRSSLLSVDRCEQILVGHRHSGRPAV